MIDFRRHGKRCSAKRAIRSHAGTIEQSDKGTVVFETENLGRQMILVDWDGAFSPTPLPMKLKSLMRMSIQTVTRKFPKLHQT
jgi:hypothetical protein